MILPLSGRQQARRGEQEHLCLYPYPSISSLASSLQKESGVCSDICRVHPAPSGYRKPGKEGKLLTGMTCTMHAPVHRVSNVDYRETKDCL